jgi:hypothetical protein
MDNAERDSHEHWLYTKRARLALKLEELPSSAWAKEKTNRERAKLSAQMRAVEREILELHQGSLFPGKQRLEG